MKHWGLELKYAFLGDVIQPITTSDHYDLKEQKKFNCSLKPHI